MRRIGLIVMVMSFAAVSAAMAQDPAKLHPDIFKIEINNRQVRVMRVTLPAHQKTDLHELRDSVIVPLTDYESVLKSGDGKTTEIKRTAGKPAWLPAGSRVIEAGDKTVEAIVIEIKPPPAAAASPPK